MFKHTYSCCLGFFFYGGLAALVLALPVWYFCIYAPPLVVSEATTYITGPLTADGQVDYFKALEERIYPPELATDDNGFREFVRQFGYVRERPFAESVTAEPKLTPEDHEFYRRQLCEKLGLDPNDLPALVFPEEPIRVFLDHYQAIEETPPESVITFKGGCCSPGYELYEENSWLRPWTLEQFPMFADWLDEIEAPMAVVAEAVRKPVFFAPLLQSRESVQSGKNHNIFETLLPGSNAARSIRTILQARANYRSAIGDIDGAIDDKLTMHRLGRLTTQGACATQYFTGYGLEQIAMTLPIGTNPEHPLTEQQIRRMLDGLDALPPRGTFADGYEWCRLAVMSDCQHLMHDPVFETMFFVTQSRPPFSDWNVVFRRVNEVCNILLVDPPPRVDGEFVRVDDIAQFPYEPWHYFPRILTSRGRGMLTADILLCWAMPPTGLMETTIQRLPCSENMQRLTLAILLYQLEHGEMPDENWAAQIEKYLGENPEQYFSCPSRPSPPGFTTYALVQYDDTVVGSHDMILLVEVSTPVPLGEAVVTADEVLEMAKIMPNNRGRFRDSPHDYVNIVSYRSGAVRALYADRAKELHRALGREEEKSNEE